MAPIIRDVNGRERSLAWAQSIFGLFGFMEDPEAEFELYEVWCMCDPGAGLPIDADKLFAWSPHGPSPRAFPFTEREVLRKTAQGGGEHVDPGAVIVVRVEDENGNPLVGIDVARWWPDPKLERLPEWLATWQEQGVYGPTNVAGDIGFGMGKGDFFDPKAKTGASQVWPQDSEGLADIGMVAGTPHWTLWPVFRKRSHVAPPIPPVDPGVDVAAARAKLAEIQRAALELQAILNP